MTGQSVMAEPSLIDRQRALLHDLAHLAAERARAAFQEARWTIDAVLEASRSKSDKKLRADEDWVAAQRDRLLALHLKARRLVEQWKQTLREPEEVPLAQRLRKVQEYLAAVKT